MLGDVAKEGGLLVGAVVVVDADVVDEGAGIGFCGEVAYGAKTLGFVAMTLSVNVGVNRGQMKLLVTKAVPYNQWQKLRVIFWGRRKWMLRYDGCFGTNSSSDYQCRP